MKKQNEMTVKEKEDLRIEKLCQKSREAIAHRTGTTNYRINFK